MIQMEKVTVEFEKVTSVLEMLFTERFFKNRNIFFWLDILPIVAEQVYLHTQKKNSLIYSVNI